MEIKKTAMAGTLESSDCNRHDLLETLKAADRVPLTTIEKLRDAADTITGGPQPVEFGECAVVCCCRIPPNLLADHILGEDLLGMPNEEQQDPLLGGQVRQQRKLGMNGMVKR